LILAPSPFLLAECAWAVYTVKFAGVVYVLHAFQKKSKIGIKTPLEEIEKVKSRLREAEKDYAEWTEQQKRKDQDDH
jgi:phage-related protein